MHTIIGKKVKVTVDRPLGSHHPKYPDIVYELNYGYVDGVIAPDGEAQDAYIIGEDKPIADFVGVVIAIIKRLDDVEDKWVISDGNTDYTKEEIARRVSFVERYFKTEIITGENYDKA